MQITSAKIQSKKQKYLIERSVYSVKSWISKTKRHSTVKSLTGKTFCRLRMSVLHLVLNYGVGRCEMLQQTK